MLIIACRDTKLELHKREKNVKEAKQKAESNRKALNEKERELRASRAELRISKEVLADITKR